MFTAVATRLACSVPRLPARSTSAAVAVPVKIPAEIPDSTRPVKSSSRWSCVTRKTTALSMEATSPGNSARRRPISSDTRPKSSRAASTPTAYAAKITVIISVEKRSSCW